MEPIKVLIVDDDPDWLSIIIQLLKREPDFSIVGTAINQADALDWVRGTDMDIVLLDLNLSGDQYDGITTALDMLRIKPLKIIITSFQDEERIAGAMKANAVNFMNNRNYQEFAAKIRDEFHNHVPAQEMEERFRRLSGALKRND
jgi:NarL family two-component system response regulator LiaR